MRDSFPLTDNAEGAVPLHTVTKSGYPNWLKEQPDDHRAWLHATHFKPKAGNHALLPGAGGALGGAVVVVDDDETGPWALGGMPRGLPEGVYKLAKGAVAPENAALGWALGSYVFDSYKDAPRKSATLVWPEKADKNRVLALAGASCLVRDLINTPAGDMTPEALAEAAQAVAMAQGASVRQIVGEALLAENFPSIYHVGKAAEIAPRLVDFTWGDANAPKVTLVGKGVTFDSGGLGIKPSGGMKLMKKDMGGAAHVIGLAQLIMTLKLPVRLRVLVPTVENAIAGNAYRPMDVIRSRSGKTIEIGHTDAEGRVIMADALSEASSESPAVLVDYATLTGAARSAVGTELAAYFSNDDETAAALEAAASTSGDPVWRLPLWDGYRHMIDGQSADITNSAESPYAGAITAGLFLREFVGKMQPWLHFDIMAWNTRARAGRPKGGEAMGLRAAFRMLEDRFGGAK